MNKIWSDKRHMVKQGLQLNIIMQARFFVQIQTTEMGALGITGLCSGGQKTVHTTRIVPQKTVAYYGDNEAMKDFTMCMYPV